MKIYTTRELSKFKTMEGNRVIYPGHVKMLMASINESNYLESNPIMVNKDYVVLDGQHRLEAAKKLGLPIYYVMVDGDLSTVHQLNTNARLWTISDFVDSYITLGHGEYTALKDFKNKWGVGYTTAAGLLSGDTGFHGTIVEDIKAGKFRVKNMDYANSVMEWVDGFNQYADPVIRKNRYFVGAVITLMKSRKATLKSLKHKLAVYAKKIERASGRVDYLRQFEAILNYKMRSQIRLY